MTETFKQIPGFARYSVSAAGTVKRLDGVVMTHSRPRDKREYPCVYLRADGERKRIAVHRLVALTWLGTPPFANAQVRHLDGDHMNPAASNLAWGTALDNAADRDAHGTTARGERPARKGKAVGAANGNYRVTPALKAQACKLVDQGYSQRMAGAALGITQKSVWQALQDRAAALRAKASVNG